MVKPSILEKSGFSGDSVLVYDITNVNDVIAIENVTGSQTVRFQDHQDINFERRYFALEPQKIKSPVDIIKTRVEGLRESTSGADYIIVTHDDFISEVELLRAHRHNPQFSGFEVKVVKTSWVYNEFSWGLFDPTAIRDFLRFTFEH